MPAIEKLHKVLDILYSDIDNKRKRPFECNEIIKYINLINDIFNYYLEKQNNNNYLNILTKVCGIYFYYFDHDDANIRIKVEESFCQLVKTHVEYVSKIQVELFKEIKKAGSTRCLRICMKYFTLLFGQIRKQKYRAYITHLYPIIQKIVKRDDEIMHEALRDFLEVILPYIGKFANHTETQALLSAFVGKLEIVNSHISIRSLAQSIAIIIQKSRHPDIYFSLALAYFLNSLLSEANSLQYGHRNKNDFTKIWSQLLVIRNLFGSKCEPSFMIPQFQFNANSPINPKNPLMDTQMLYQHLGYFLKLTWIICVAILDQLEDINVCNVSVEILFELLHLYYLESSGGDGGLMDFSKFVSAKKKFQEIREDCKNVVHNVPDIIKEVPSFFTSNEPLPQNKDEFASIGPLSIPSPDSFASTSKDVDLNIAFDKMESANLSESNLCKLANLGSSEPLDEIDDDQVSTIASEEASTQQTPSDDLIYEKEIINLMNVTSLISNTPMDEEENSKFESLQKNDELPDTLEEFTKDTEKEIQNDDTTFDIALYNNNNEDKAVSLLEILASKLLTQFLICYRRLDSNDRGDNLDDPFCNNELQPIIRRRLYQGEKLLISDLFLPQTPLIPSATIKITLQTSALKLLNVLIPKLPPETLFSSVNLALIQNLPHGTEYPQLGEDKIRTSHPMKREFQSIFYDLLCSVERATDPSFNGQYAKYIVTYFNVLAVQRLSKTNGIESFDDEKYLKASEIILLRLIELGSGDGLMASSPLIQSSTFLACQQALNCKFGRTQREYGKLVHYLTLLDPSSNYWLSKVNYLKCFENLGWFDYYLYRLPNRRQNKQIQIQIDTKRFSNKLHSLMFDEDKRVRDQAIDSVTKLLRFNIITEADQCITDTCDYLKIYAQSILNGQLELNAQSSIPNYHSFDLYLCLIHSLPKCFLHESKYTCVFPTTLSDPAITSSKPKTDFERANCSNLIRKLLELLVPQPENLLIKLRVLEVLARILDKYPPIINPHLWSIKVIKPISQAVANLPKSDELSKFSNTQEQNQSIFYDTIHTQQSNNDEKTNNYYSSQITLINPQKYRLNFRNDHSVYALFVSYLNFEETILDFTAHINLLKIINSLSLAYVYHNSSMPISYTCNAPFSQHWPAIQDRYLILPLDRYLAHLLTVLAICCDVIALGYILTSNIPATTQLKRLNKQMPTNSNLIYPVQQNSQNKSFPQTKPEYSTDASEHINTSTVSTIPMQVSKLTKGSFNRISFPDLFGTATKDGSQIAPKTAVNHMENRDLPQSTNEPATSKSQQTTSTSSLGQRLAANLRRKGSGLLFSSNAHNTTVLPKKVVGVTANANPHSITSQTKHEATKIGQGDTTNKTDTNKSSQKTKIKSADGGAKSYEVPFVNFIHYEHVPLYRKLFELTRRSFHNYLSSLKDDGEQKYYQLLEQCLTSLNSLLEVMSFYETSKIIDSLLQHCLAQSFSVMPKYTIQIVTQLLKSIFGTNTLYSDKKKTTLASSSINRSFIDMFFHNDDPDEEPLDLKCDEASFDNLYLGWKARLAETPSHLKMIEQNFDITGDNCYDDADLSDNNSEISGTIERSYQPTLPVNINAYISKFEDTVIRSLKLYTLTSDTDVQNSILDMLIELILLRVNYKLLDSDSLFLDFLIKQIEFIEQGYYQDCPELVYKLFQFFSLLCRDNASSSHQPTGKETDKMSQLTLPKLVNLVETIIATTSHESRFLACGPLFVLVQEVFIANDYSHVTENMNLEFPANVIPNQFDDTNSDIEANRLQIAADALRDSVFSLLCKNMDNYKVLTLIAIVLQKLSFDANPSSSKPQKIISFYTLALECLERKFLNLVVESDSNLLVNNKLIDGSFPTSDLHNFYISLRHFFQTCLTTLQQFYSNDSIDSSVYASLFTDTFTRIISTTATDSKDIQASNKKYCLDVILMISPLSAITFILSKQSDSQIGCTLLTPKTLNNILAAFADFLISYFNHAERARIDNFSFLFEQFCDVLWDISHSKQQLSDPFQEAIKLVYDRFLNINSIIYENISLLLITELPQLIRYFALLSSFYLKPCLEFKAITSNIRDGLLHSINFCLLAWTQITFILTDFSNSFTLLKGNEISTKIQQGSIPIDFNILLTFFEENCGSEAFFKDDCLLIYLIDILITTSEDKYSHLINHMVDHEIITRFVQNIRLCLNKNLVNYSNVEPGLFSSIILRCYKLLTLIYGKLKTKMLTMSMSGDSNKIATLRFNILKSLIDTFYWNYRHPYLRYHTRKLFISELEHLLETLQGCDYNNEFSSTKDYPVVIKAFIYAFPQTYLITDIIAKAKSAIPFTKFNFDLEIIEQFIRTLYPGPINDQTLKVVSQRAEEHSKSKNEILNKGDLLGMYQKLIGNYPQGYSPWLGQSVLQLQIDDIASFLTITENFPNPHLLSLFAGLQQYLYRKIVRGSKSFDFEAAYYNLLCTKYFASMSQPNLLHRPTDPKTSNDDYIIDNQEKEDISFALKTLSILTDIPIMHPTFKPLFQLTIPQITSSLKIFNASLERYITWPLPKAYSITSNLTALISNLSRYLCVIKPPDIDPEYSSLSFQFMELTLNYLHAILYPIDVLYYSRCYNTISKSLVRLLNFFDNFELGQANISRNDVEALRPIYRAIYYLFRIPMLNRYAIFKQPISSCLPKSSSLDTTNHLMDRDVPQAMTLCDILRSEESKLCSPQRYYEFYDVYQTFCTRIAKLGWSNISIFQEAFVILTGAFNQVILPPLKISSSPDDSHQKTIDWDREREDFEIGVLTTKTLTLFMSYTMLHPLPGDPISSMYPEVDRNLGPFKPIDIFNKYGQDLSNVYTYLSIANSPIHWLKETPDWPYRLTLYPEWNIAKLSLRHIWNVMGLRCVPKHKITSIDSDKVSSEQTTSTNFEKSNIFSDMFTSTPSRQTNLSDVSDRNATILVPTEQLLYHQTKPLIPPTFGHGQSVTKAAQSSGETFSKIPDNTIPSSVQLLIDISQNAVARLVNLIVYYHYGVDVPASNYTFDSLSKFGDISKLYKTAQAGDETYLNYGDFTIKEISARRYQPPLKSLDPETLRHINFLPRRKLLLEILKMVIYLSDLFTGVTQWEWMQKLFCNLYDAFEEEINIWVQTAPALKNTLDFSSVLSNADTIALLRDEISVPYIVLGLVKSSAALGLNHVLCETLTKLITQTLRSTSISSKIITFKSCLYVFESNPYLTENLVNFISNHAFNLFEFITPDTLVSFPYVRCLLDVLFYLAETFQNIPVDMTPRDPFVNEKSLDPFIRKLVGVLIKNRLYSGPQTAKQHGMSNYPKYWRLVLPPSSTSHGMGSIDSMSITNHKVIEHLCRLLLLNVITSGNLCDNVVSIALSGLIMVINSDPFVTLESPFVTSVYRNNASNWFVDNGGPVSFNFLKLLIVAFYVNKQMSLLQSANLNTSDLSKKTGSHQTQKATYMLLEAMELFATELLTRSNGQALNQYVVKAGPCIIPQCVTHFSFPSDVIDKFSNRFLGLVVSQSSLIFSQEFDSPHRSINLAISPDPINAILHRTFLSFLNVTAWANFPISNTSPKRLELDWILVILEKLSSKISSDLCQIIHIKEASSTKFSNLSSDKLRLHRVTYQIWMMAILLYIDTNFEEYRTLLAYLSFRACSYQLCIEGGLGDTDIIYSLFERFYSQLPNSSEAKRRFKDVMTTPFRSFQTIPTPPRTGIAANVVELLSQNISEIFTGNLDPLREIEN